MGKAQDMALFAMRTGVTINDDDKKTLLGEFTADTDNKLELMPVQSSALATRLFQATNSTWLASFMVQLWWSFTHIAIPSSVWHIIMNDTTAAERCAMVYRVATVKKGTVYRPVNRMTHVNGSHSSRIIGEYVSHDAKGNTVLKGYRILLDNVHSLDIATDKQGCLIKRTWSFQTLWSVVKPALKVVALNEARLLTKTYVTHHPKGMNTYHSVDYRLVRKDSGSAN